MVGQLRSNFGWTSLCPSFWKGRKRLSLEPKWGFYDLSMDPPAQSTMNVIYAMFPIQIKIYAVKCSPSDRRLWAAVRRFMSPCSIKDEIVRLAIKSFHRSSQVGSPLPKLLLSIALGKLDNGQDGSKEEGTFTGTAAAPSFWNSESGQQRTCVLKHAFY